MDRTDQNICVCVWKGDAAGNIAVSLNELTSAENVSAVCSRSLNSTGKIWANYNYDFIIFKQ